MRIYAPDAGGDFHLAVADGPEAVQSVLRQQGKALVALASNNSDAQRLIAYELFEAQTGDGPFPVQVKVILHIKNSNEE